MPAALAGSADDVLVGHEDVVEEEFREGGLSVEPSDGPYGHAVGVEREHQVGQALVRIALVQAVPVAAEETEGAVGEGCAGGPGLLAVQQPAPVGTSGGGAERGEVRTGLGFRPRLRPDHLAGGHRGQDAGALLGGAVLEEGGGEQVDAVLADPAGRAGRVVLLLEDQPVQYGSSPASVLLGPGHHRPTVGGQGALPDPVGGEALLGLQRGQGPFGHVGGEPGAGLGPEGVLGRREVEVHQAPAPSLTSVW